MGLLPHVVHEAHVVLVEIGQLLHFYLFVVAFSIFGVGVWGAYGVLDVIIHIILNNLVDDLLLLVVIGLLHKPFTLGGRHYVAFES
jgi:hypothetical protein